MSERKWFLSIILAIYLVAPKQGLSDVLSDPLAKIEEVVFSVRSVGGDGHWYANFGYWCSDSRKMMFGRGGGRLAKLNLNTGKATTILDAGNGSVRDPQIHYDGQKILFSFRRSDSLYYNIYEINLDGTRLRQITRGDFDDIEPIYLPDGGIMFCSSRCNRWVNCWHTQVAVLHRCDPKGGNIQIVSSNIEQDNTPWMLPDGRVLYMRWEYIDRSRTKYHHLWTMNPDGTGQMVFYGNMHPGTVMLDAKPIPGTQKIVSIFSPGHGRKEHAGRVTIVDPRRGPDERSQARTINNDQDLRDPYPLSKDCLLAARKNQLIVMDGQGQTKVLYTLGPEERGFELHEPRPINPRKREQVIPFRTDMKQPTGRLILTNIYQGRNMEGLSPGEIKKLLVMETLPKPVNHSGTMEPISLGGTFTLPRILGTIPVERDGSAYMEIPPLRSIFFIALDDNNMSVKRMQSFTTVMPGETTGCLGCHEQRIQSPKNPNQATAMALNRPPSRIKPLANIPDVFDFPRDIQPIMDKHCIECHNYDKPSGRTILTGDRGPIYSHAYANLLSRKDLVSHGRDAGGNLAPRRIGSSASRLMKMIDGSHHNVKVTRHEKDMILYWIESGAPYAGTYAALGTGIVMPLLNSDPWNRRCSSCHKKQDTNRAQAKPEYNLSFPEKSLLLLAPLAKEAGGYQICKPKEQKGTSNESFFVFSNTADPDYQELLSQIEHAKQQLDNQKRFDMPGFQPSRHYVREMKKYDILPPDLSAETPIDVYAADRKYWRSHWYAPKPGKHEK